VIVHYEVIGPEDAPPLVLSNSLGANLSMWNPQAVALAQRFRVVRYDTRGHGDSPVPDGPYTLDDLGQDALALLDFLGIERAHWVGLSLGGMTGMWLAINAPERLHRLVLLCTSAKLGPPETWRERAEIVRAQGTEAVADAGVGRWLTERFRRENPDTAAWLRDMIAATPDAGYAACCAVIEHMDLTAGLAGITTPTLAIAGAQDPATPPEHAQAIVSAIPGARLEVLDPAAHLANVEQPNAVSQLIRDHLEAGMDDPYDAGMRVRREVLGDAHVERATANATEFSRPFQEFITRAAWGEVWTRPGLDRRTRSVITLSVLTALRAENEIPMHVRAAITNGLTPEEIREVLIHTAVYAGVPAANSAIALAQKTLDEL
jgi:3-oxoadipate enol-lactonase/4-carboxymuconolactone decarboxylase